MQHVVLIFKWIFLFYTAPPPPSPLAHSFSLTYAFFLCFCKMPSRCWQRVTAGRLCHCHAHHTVTHTHTHGCSSVYCAPPPFPPTPLRLYYYCYYYYFHHCLQHFRFALCVWSTSECIHTFAFAFILTQTHWQIPPKSVYTCKLKHSRGSLRKLLTLRLLTQLISSYHCMIWWLICGPGNDLLFGINWNECSHLLGNIVFLKITLYLPDTPVYYMCSAVSF